jgi:hypothetical protein
LYSLGPGGVGHHFIPMQILKELLDGGKISLDAFQVGTGIYSGPTNPKHDYGTYGGVTHDKYNEVIREQIDDYMTKNGKTQLSKADVHKLAGNFANGKGATGKIHPEIRDFNSAVIKLRIDRKNKWTIPSVKDSKTQGLDYIKNNKGRLTPDQLAKFDSRLKQTITNGAKETSTMAGPRSKEAIVGVFALFSSVFTLNAVAGENSNLDKAIEELQAGSWVNFKHYIVNPKESFAVDIYEAYSTTASINRVFSQEDFVQMAKQFLNSLDSEAGQLIQENSEFWQRYDELENKEALGSLPK